MNISIIIPNFNGEELLKKNLPHVLEAVKLYRKGKIEIIIPNDPSTDKSKVIISKFINSIHEKNITGLTVDNNQKNKAGFSKNINRGVMISSGDILILLNSDVYPHKDFLEPLLMHFEDESVFAVGCLDESIENREKVLRGRGVGVFKRGFLSHSAGSLDKKNTLWVSGGSGAFRKSIWDKFGGFDPLYDPFYWEDIDLSYQAQKSGYKVIFEPSSIVTHEHEKGVVKEMFSDDFVKKISYRNQFIFVWKNITDPYLILLHIFWLPYHILRSLVTADWDFFGGLFLASANFVRINKSRQKAKKSFVKLDHQVLKENNK